MTKTKTKTAYALMWMTTECVYSLQYGDGAIRTYLEGHLDPRAGDEDSLPRIKTWDDAINFFAAHRGDKHKALVSVAVAKRIYDDDTEFADPV